MLCSLLALRGPEAKKARESSRNWGVAPSAEFGRKRVFLGWDRRSGVHTAHTWRTAKRAETPQVQFTVSAPIRLYKVDVVLQGQDRLYARSKRWREASPWPRTCPAGIHDLGQWAKMHEV